MKRESTARALRRMELRLQSLEKRVMELSKLIVEELYGGELGDEGDVGEAHLERLKESGLLGELDNVIPEDVDEEDDEEAGQPKEKWIV